MHRGVLSRQLSSYKLVKGDLAEIRKKPGCLTFTLEGRDANSDRGNVGDSYKSLGKIDIAAIRVRATDTRSSLKTTPSRRTS
ncbi:uncharacterized protein YALI1_A06818g [Yarrowia lipolytica]|uniref:Uncharacterized protein n=1 Tax=Yarrowia lipolytica TaxID=4952 RepID=A0A1D8N421_YARLL|nr:hypothetical protein YALI1_A06818g [Yarrowia lipolytica]